MLIAIIDDGIDVSFIEGLQLKYDLAVGPDGMIRNRKKNEPILTDHGTTCAGIILKYAPDAEFCSLRIFHEETCRTDCEMLVAALEWCLSNKIPIIHVSAGTSHLNDYPKIRAIVAKMIHNRQLIVSAYSNDEPYSIPAGLAGVFGVVADENMTADEFAFVPTKNLHMIKASSQHELSWPFRQIFTTQISNSYAAPTITAAIYNIASKEKPLSISIAKVLKSLRGKTENMLFRKPDFIEDALLYNPYNYPILMQHLFFNCVGELTLPTSSEPQDLVVLAPIDASSTDVEIQFLQENENRFRSVLYGGMVSESSTLPYRDELFWSEDSCCFEESVENYAANIEDCPVVNIYGDDLQSIELLCHLRDLFAEEDYRCVGVSNHRFSYLYMLEYIACASDKNSAIQYINRMYDPDIIICCWQMKNPMFSLETDEYHIFTESLIQSNALSSEAHITAKDGPAAVVFQGA